MATGASPLSFSGSACFNSLEIKSTKSTSIFTFSRKLNNHQGAKPKLTVHAEYSDRKGGGGGGDFVAGFLLGGAIFGTLAYVFAPQGPSVSDGWIHLILDCLLNFLVNVYYAFVHVLLRLNRPPHTFGNGIRRSVLNEDEYGFRRAKRPIYYDEGLERNRQILNEKLGQLNSAIDNVSSRLRGGNNMPPVPVESDPEEATM